MTHWKDTLQEDKWYYFFLSVDYVAQQAYHAYYTPYTSQRYSNLASFTSVNPAFDESLALIISPWHGDQVCGACGTYSNLFAILEFMNDEGDSYLYQNGLDGIIT